MAKQETKFNLSEKVFFYKNGEIINGFISQIIIGKESTICEVVHFGIDGAIEKSKEKEYLIFTTFEETISHIIGNFKTDTYFIDEENEKALKERI